MTGPILRLDGIRVERNGVLILDDIDWTVEPEQHWAVLGLNGAGKSTLIEVILAHLPATKGAIELLGSRYGHADWRNVRTRVGIVSQAFALRIPNRETVATVIASGATGSVGTRRPITPAQRREIQPWLETFGLENRADQPWNRLSQGERQRTLIARTFHIRPELIILDEPCAGLDPIARHNLLGRLEEASADPSSPPLIYITHHIAEIRPMFTHILGLADGRVVVNDVRREALQQAPLERVYQHPVRIVEDDEEIVRLVIPAD